MSAQSSHISVRSEKIIEMDKSQMDVITLCDYDRCPTVKSNNEANALIVVKSDGESQPIDNCIGHRFEPLENRAIGGALY